MKKNYFMIVLFSFFLTQPAVSEDNDYLFSLYQWLHANPELSFFEQHTSARITKELEYAGFKVTDSVGGYGVVGVLANGEGPTLLIRTDLDAIPVVEQTGLSYASKKYFTIPSGKKLPVSHACGHDVHMSVFIGTARYLANNLDRWRGNLVMVGQPAEERGAGARAMLKDGLYSRFPKPDFNLALHVTENLPAGSVGYRSGYMTAAVDKLSIKVPGIGGHGALPHRTKDPVVLAASIVMQLQTLVSREINPVDPAVLSIGTIHGGSKGNIIANEVLLEGTIRYFSEATGQLLRDGIRRIAKAEALAMGLPPKLQPEVSFGVTPGLGIWNDPELNEILVKTFEKVFGDEHVVELPATTTSEDFAFFGAQHPRIPSVMFQLGAVDAEQFTTARISGVTLPGPHSPFFSPDAKNAIKTGVQAMSNAAMKLLSPSNKTNSYDL